MRILERRIGWLVLWVFASLDFLMAPFMLPYDYWMYPRDSIRLFGGLWLLVTIGTVFKWGRLAIGTLAGAFVGLSIVVSGLSPFVHVMFFALLGLAAGVIVDIVSSPKKSDTSSR